MKYCDILEDKINGSLEIIKTNTMLPDEEKQSILLPCQPSKEENLWT